MSRKQAQRVIAIPGSQFFNARNPDTMIYLAVQQAQDEIRRQISDDDGEPFGFPSVMIEVRVVQYYED
jgi:hypothetical protein